MVRLLRHPYANVPPLTASLEGEQFANAYFDTETKIKMLVPRFPPALTTLEILC